MSSFLFSISANKIRRKKKKNDDNISFFLHVQWRLGNFLLCYLVTWVFFFNVHLLSSHTLSVDYLYRRLISERLQIHTHIYDNWTCDRWWKKDRWSIIEMDFLFGKILSVLLLVRIRDRIDRKLDLQIITVISRLYSSILRRRLNSFTHPSKFNPYIPVNLSGKETSFYAFPILIFFFFYAPLHRRKITINDKRMRKRKKKRLFHHHHRVWSKQAYTVNVIWIIRRN